MQLLIGQFFVPVLFYQLVEFDYHMWITFSLDRLE